MVLVVTFLGLCWWQVTRAIGGNSLSWAYVFEWPLFAGYLIYMWRKLSREREPTGGAPSGGAAETGGDVEPSAGQGPDTGDEEDEELAAYNRYLAALDQTGRRKRW